MTESIHRASGLVFYLLGTTLIAAYVLMANKIYTAQSAWWLQRADLPFALAAILYGGTSLYLSLNPKQKRVPVLAAFIIIPLAAFFIFLVILNFWESLGLPAGQTMI